MQLPICDQQQQWSHNYVALFQRHCRFLLKRATHAKFAVSPWTRLLTLGLRSMKTLG